MKYIKILLIPIALFVSCTGVENTFELPYLGRDQIVEGLEDGIITYDTIPHQIENFDFINQDSIIVTNATFEGKIYIADFFFTSCPTICPIMKKEMLRVYKAFENNQEVMLLSHTIDPEYDTIERLKDFSERLGVRSDKWHFITGDKEDIYGVGERSYMVVADEDPTAPGGFIHSGAFLLVDKERHIRGVYDGTVSTHVDLLIKDVNRLLQSYEAE